MSRSVAAVSASVKMSKPSARASNPPSSDSLTANTISSGTSDDRCGVAMPPSLSGMSAHVCSAGRPAAQAEHGIRDAERPTQGRAPIRKIGRWHTECPSPCRRVGKLKHTCLPHSRERTVRGWTRIDGGQRAPLRWRSPASAPWPWRSVPNSVGRGCTRGPTFAMTLRWRSFEIVRHPGGRVSCFSESARGRSGGLATGGAWPDRFHSGDSEPFSARSSSRWGRPRGLASWLGTSKQPRLSSCTATVGKRTDTLVFKDPGARAGCRNLLGFA